MNVISAQKPKPNAYGMEVVQPIYECPQLADQLLKQIGYIGQKPSSTAKAKIVAASFLHATHQVRQNSSKAIGWPGSHEYWSQFPSVGRTIAEDIRSKLIASDLMTKIPNTGQTNFDSDGNVIGKITSLFLPTKALLDTYSTYLGQFLDPHRHSVKVAKPESYPQKLKRRSKGGSSEKYTKSECKTLFKGEWTKVVKRIEAINDYYYDHPMMLNTGFKCCSVTRIFNNSSLTEGGRLYGAYSNLGKDDRLEATIDGNPVCEIDLVASQPTLLSALLGHKIGNTWSDLYSLLPSVRDEKDQQKRKEIRSYAKLVISELTGTGNPAKMSPSDELRKKGVDDFLFISLREEALKAIPALAKMKEKKIKSNNYLAFHEAEVILATIEALKAKGVTAYSMHDAIIVADKHVELSLNTLQKVWSDYCLGERPGSVDSRIHPALNITYADGTTSRIYGSWK